MSGARAAFIDRDGTVNKLVRDPRSGHPESPLRPQDVTLLARAPEALVRLAQAGWLLIGISNQPAAAKGTIALKQLLAVHARVLELLAARGARFDDFRLCLHHPGGVVPELTCECGCRKPGPGMLLEAAATLGVDLGRSWMIGDTDGDVLAGRAAGVRTILIEHPESAHKRSGNAARGGNAAPDAMAPDLYAAAEFLLAEPGPRPAHA